MENETTNQIMGKRFQKVGDRALFLQVCQETKTEAVQTSEASVAEIRLVVSSKI